MAAELPSREDFLKGLQPITISNLPEGTFSDATCGICLGDLSDKAESDGSERAVRLHGDHFYGEQCIRRWLEGNDSCPHCRKKIHGGIQQNIPNEDPLAGLDDDIYVAVLWVDERGFAADLAWEAAYVLQLNPSIMFPMNDAYLWNMFARLREGVSFVGSDDLRVQLFNWSLFVLERRAEWWSTNPAFLNMSHFTPYARTERLRVENLNAPLVVRMDGMDALDALATLGAAFTRGIENALNGHPLHVATHPLSFTAARAIRLQLRQYQGRVMTVSMLTSRLCGALESNLLIRGLGGDRDDLPMGLRSFCDDMVIRIVNDLIQGQ